MRMLGLFAAVLLAFSAQAKITVSGVVTDKNGKPVSKCDVFFNQKA